MQFTRARGKRFGKPKLHYLAEQQRFKSRNGIPLHAGLTIAWFLFNPTGFISQ